MYTLQESPYIVASIPAPVLYFSECKSWEDFCEEDVYDHYKNIYKLLAKRVTSLEDPSVALSQNDESEIQFMLESLLQVKRIIEEEK